mmetsp:Transcript_141603/g.452825  ORF Transcript_141603/g.452825 Transcript_141603/m.452825 type:complete len:1022 (+) Transcript_141603:1009-4074(+)
MHPPIIARCLSSRQPGLALPLARVPAVPALLRWRRRLGRLCRAAAVRRRGSKATASGRHHGSHWLRSVARNVVHDPHEGNMGLQLVLAIRCDHLKAGAQQRSRVDLELNRRTGIENLNAPPATLHALVRFPRNVQRSFGELLDERHGTREVAGDLVAANLEAVVDLLGVEAQDVDTPRPKRGDHGLLALGIGSALEAEAAGRRPAPVDERAGAAGARGLPETGTIDAAQHRPATAIGHAPIHIVVGDGRLVEGSVEDQGALDEAQATISVAGPAQSPRSRDGPSVVLQRHPRCRALELGRQLTNSTARDRHEVACIRRGHEGAIDLQGVLGGTRRGDRLAETLQLEAGTRHEVDPVVLDVRLVRGRRDGDGAPIHGDVWVHVLEGQGQRRMRRRLWGRKGPGSLKGVLRVDQAARADLALQRGQLADAAEDDILDLVHGELGAVHPDQCGHACDVWRGHGCAAETPVTATRNGGVDVTARSGHMHGVHAGVRECRQRAEPSCRGHRDDVGAVDIRGVARRQVVVVGLVACRCREEHTSGLGVLDGHPQGRVRAAAAPGVARDLGTLRDSIIDGLDRIGDAAGASTVQELQSHQAHPSPSHTCNALPIVANARNSARAMCAVHHVVHWIPILVGKVGAMDVINDAILIVVDAVARNLQRVHPHLLPEILVVVVDARVDDCHSDALADLASPDLPGLRGIDVEASPVVHSPEIGECGVVCKVLARPLDLKHLKDEGLVRVLAARDQEATLFKSEELVEAARERDGPIESTAELEPLPAEGFGPVCADLALLVCIQELAKLALEGDGAVVVCHHRELAIVLQGAAGLEQGTSLSRSEMSAVRSLQLHEVRPGRGTAAQHRAVDGGAAIAHQAAHMASRVGRTLCLLLALGSQGPAEGLLHISAHAGACGQEVESMDPSVEHGEFDFGIHLKILNELLPGFGGNHADHNHADLRQRLRLHHARPGLQLLRTTRPRGSGRASVTDDHAMSAVAALRVCRAIAKLTVGGGSCEDGRKQPTPRHGKPL